MEIKVSWLESNAPSLLIAPYSDEMRRVDHFT